MEDDKIKNEESLNEKYKEKQHDEAEEHDNIAKEGESDSDEKKAKKQKKQSKQENKTEELEDKYQEINEKYLRLYSEFDNFRKRSIKERIDYVQNASKDLIIDLLPILDDFERAIKSSEEDISDNIDTLKEGIQLIYNKFKSILKAKGLEEINAMGENFDTDFHEAVTQIKADKKDKGKVIDVIEKGYLLNDKVIRYAKVVVGQ